ncbi:putative NBD/HSP70 family sugar kinase [Pseudonocardia sediminis]|uniref:Putative NBD/HSP70 family sugar kinase n=1 Tax=Pseudonocardia sediminis TaxID=1397368 RepID=A0A4Q7UW26_PSEST|nr:ROK family transcriptional regulator [Pseudonocardia sediminis]RZT84269.1 putative NBD/HSP70 family sugar kinase [Pseudonocardia sediminis]
MSTEICGDARDTEPGRAAVERWRTTAEVLAEVRRRPGLTRVELARELNLASASATEITGRLRELGWIAEERAPSTGRGRPTTVVTVAPDGPVVVAVDVRYEDWRAALARLDGVPIAVRTGRHAHRDADTVVGTLRGVVAEMVRDSPGPVVGAGIAVAATVVDEHLAQDAGQGWSPLQPSRITEGTGVPVVVGNDATLAGVAEVRDGAAVGAGTALFLTVEVGIGGTLVVDGRPLSGARGTAGEYGHLPFGDPGRRCHCGARGCWHLDIGGRALAARMNEPSPSDPFSHALRVLDRAADGDAAAREAVAHVASRLARGVAGLVNVHDPDVTVLGGLGPALRAAAAPEFDEAYTDGLMAFRRDAPPPVRDAAHGPDATLRGALAIALDDATSPTGLARRS